MASEHQRKMRQFCAAPLHNDAVRKSFHTMSSDLAAHTEVQLNAAGGNPRQPKSRATSTTRADSGSRINHFIIKTGVVCRRAATPLRREDGQRTVLHRGGGGRALRWAASPTPKQIFSFLIKTFPAKRRTDLRSLCLCVCWFARAPVVYAKITLWLFTRAATVANSADDADQAVPASPHPVLNANNVYMYATHIEFWRTSSGTGVAMECDARKTCDRTHSLGTAYSYTTQRCCVLPEGTVFSGCCFLAVGRGKTLIRPTPEGGRACAAVAAPKRFASVDFHVQHIRIWGRGCCKHVGSAKLY